MNCEINYRIYFNKMTVKDFFSHLLQFSKVGELIKNKTLHDLFYFYFIFTEIRVGGFVNHLIKKWWPKWRRMYCFCLTYSVWQLIIDITDMPVYIKHSVMWLWNKDYFGMLCLYHDKVYRFSKWLTVSFCSKKWKRAHLHNVVSS